MKKSDNELKTQFGIVLPRLWDLPLTKQTNHNYTALFEQFNRGAFYNWIVKHPVWFRRFFQCKAGVGDIYLCYKDTRTPWAWLDAEKIDVFQIDFRFDYSIKVRVDEKRWFLYDDVTALAQSMGFPDAKTYVAYISKYHQRYSTAYLLCLTEKRLSDAFTHTQKVI